MVAFLLEQRGLAPKDLWPVVGSKNRVSEIFGGKRSMTKEQAKISLSSSMSVWAYLSESRRALSLGGCKCMRNW